MKKISRLKTFSCASMIILSCTLVGCTTPEEEKEDELKKFTNSLEIVIPLVNNEVLFGDYRAYEDFLEKTSSVRI